MFIDILNPMTIIRIWTVDCSNMDRGVFKSFWFKKSAMKYFEEMRHAYAIIRLRNEITGGSETLIDNWGEKYAKQGMVC